MRRKTFIRALLLACGVAAAAPAHAVVKSGECTRQWDYWRLEFLAGRQPGPKPGPDAFKNECYDKISTSTVSDADKGEYRYTKCNGVGFTVCYRSDGKVLTDALACKNTTLVDLPDICPSIIGHVKTAGLCTGTKMMAASCDGHHQKCGTTGRPTYVATTTPALGTTCVLTSKKVPNKSPLCYMEKGGPCSMH